MSFLIKIYPDQYYCGGTGDPGRTLLKENAKRYDSESSARIATSVLNSKYPHRIYEVVEENLLSQFEVPYGYSSWANFLQKHPGLLEIDDPQYKVLIKHEKSRELTGIRLSEIFREVALEKLQQQLNTEECTIILRALEAVELAYTGLTKTKIKALGDKIYHIRYLLR
ncbi:hypothetical protein [Parapedobacter indicus]|uniref:Uncharacterized protein n=1 Tax=Parapedobacter indicus TaxID=1477437 RepID=A0A1I3UZI2_9SPHI|nr:hypothetical protein [Parapedobacter indicus]PPK99023.1 hypothetical protein CLV26_11553 [Parapedobacter indicus]SFJ88365.1 hypothetical protein SAMN05444682_115124 [Parapedobacter indicus]